MSIELFQSAEWSVRVIDIDGEPWFVGRDVCTVLGLNNARQALSTLDDDEKGVTTADTLGALMSGAVTINYLRDLVDRSHCRSVPNVRTLDLTEEVTP